MGRSKKNFKFVSTVIDMSIACNHQSKDAMLQAVCDAAKEAQSMFGKNESRNAKINDETETNICTIDLTNNHAAVPSSIVTALKQAKKNAKMGNQSSFNLGMAIQATSFLMIMIRSDMALSKRDMCWARLLRSANVSEDMIRNVNICLSVSKRLWKSGESRLPTADAKTVECVFCSLYALIKSEPSFLADVYPDMVEGIPRQFRSMLRQREREFQEITDNFIFIFRDVEENRRPPYLCISKDEQYITLSIGSPVTF